MIVSNELRSALASLDGELSEALYLIEQEDQDEDCADLQDQIHNMQYEITDIQEQQGWI